MKKMPNPSEQTLKSELFETIWQCIKSWDLNVPEYYNGYCGANGSHVQLILEAIQPEIIKLISAFLIYDLDMGDSNNSLENSPVLINITERLFKPQPSDSEKGL